MALQMSWQPSLLHHKRKIGPPLGLKNIGNSCYLNSVLQCLTYTPPLANFCLKNQHSSSCDSAAEPDRKRECPFCILEKQIARSLSIDQTLDTPSKMNSCLRIFAEHFRLGRQEDAHEFLRYVIDACHNTCLRLKKLQQLPRKGGGGGGGASANESSNGSTVVKEIFGGALQSQVKCLSCGGESNKVDEIMDISLDLLHSSSLKESLQKFFQAEVLDGNNKYKCENCKKLVAARKQMSLLQAPNVLVIQLKRFEGVFGGKIDKAIAFEEVLVLSSYMCKESQDTYPQYNLFGTIVHSGFSPHSGHYYAYIKDAMGRWYCCDDSIVKLSNLQEVLSEKVYILFFSRTKQRPMPANTALASNGVKSQECNGSDTSKSQKLAHSVRAVYTEQSVDHSFEKDNLARSKDNGVLSSAQANLSSFGNCGTQKCTVTVNGKVDNLTRSKDNGVLSSAPVNLSSFGSSGTQKFTATVNGKIDNLTRSKDNGVLSSVQANLSSFGNSGTQKCTATVNGKVDNLTRSKDNGVLSSAQANLSSFGNSGTRMFTATVNGKIDVHKNQSNGKNGDVKASISTEKGEKNMSSLNGNGFAKSKTVEANGNGNSQAIPIANGNGKTKSTPGTSVEVGMPDDNHGRNGVKMGRVTCKHELKNGGVNCPSDISGSKRKLQDEDSCILFAKDGNSQAKLEELKEVLQKEAFSVLRSCGWTEEVSRAMCTRKKVCAQETGDIASNGNELKKLLMTDAKRIFVSQIPESLKENLIKRLRSFSQEKQHSGP